MTQKTSVLNEQQVQVVVPGTVFHGPCDQQTQRSWEYLSWRRTVLSRIVTAQSPQILGQIQGHARNHWVITVSLQI